VAVANYFAAKGWKIAAFGKASSEPPHEIDRRVDCLGVLKTDKLHELFGLSKVFFDSSLYEGFGILPREAINAGCRVVAIENGGNENEAMKDSFELVSPWDLVSILESIGSARDQKSAPAQPAQTVTLPLSHILKHNLENPRKESVVV
jgi:hypothetical protein